MLAENLHIAVSTESVTNNSVWLRGLRVTGLHPSMGASLRIKLWLTVVRREPFSEGPALRALFFSALVR